MRHWLRNRAALTRPNFGTAIRMSNTLAVETYSGGALRIVSILTRPSFRSFFNLARLTRMSFARLRASILWSRDRAGAWAWAFVDETIERASLTTSQRRSISIATRTIRARRRPRARRHGWCRPRQRRAPPAPPRAPSARGWAPPDRGRGPSRARRPARPRRRARARLDRS